MLPVMGYSTKTNITNKTAQTNIISQNTSAIDEY